MSKIATDTVPDLASPLARDLGSFDMTVASNRSTAVEESPYGGRAVIKQEARITTAQRVAVPRDMAALMQKLAILCASFGDRFVYSWEVNDNANRRKQVIEGGTIQLANAIVSIYGNCAVECDIEDTKDHWVFKAYFMDYEAGVTVSRLFQQRKKSTMGGRYEADRALDMQFQIGQSKAIRNVVLNALGYLRDYAVEQSKQAVVRKFNSPENRDKAWAFIDMVIAEHGIDIKQLEAVRGRKAKNFTVQDLARTYTEVMAIHDGMADPADIFPSQEDAAAMEAGDGEAADTTQPRKPRGGGKKEEKNVAGNADQSGAAGGSVSPARGSGGSGGAGDAGGSGSSQGGKAANGSAGENGAAESGAGNEGSGSRAGGEAGRGKTSSGGREPAPEVDDDAGHDAGASRGPGDGGEDRDGDADGADQDAEGAGDDAGLFQE